VIKADDEASLRSEVEEYVLTNEVAKRLDHFLGRLHRLPGANGVWISGFFGSGKSHLLKMLALLLENRAIDGSSALELFLPKSTPTTPCCAPRLKRPSPSPRKSILFNIDQKADMISKSRSTRCWRCSSRSSTRCAATTASRATSPSSSATWTAATSMQPLRIRLSAIAGLPWERGREQALLESGNIASRLRPGNTGAPISHASGILDKYRNHYSVSIEDFANQVKAWHHKQGRTSASTSSWTRSGSTSPTTSS
jgi:hypothetical protein